MEYNSSIWSDDEVLKFYNNVLVNLSCDEADFFCIAARKKYMTEKERLTTRMGDTCMMSKTILKSHDANKFLNKLHQVDAGLDWYTALNGERLPRSCMVFYINVNHTSVPKAVRDFKHELAEYDYEFSTASMKNNSDNASRKLAGIHNRILKAFQDPRNQLDKIIDIDMDVDKSVIKPDLIFETLNNLEQVYDEPALGRTFIVETQGGYHVLVSKQMMSIANKGLSNFYSGHEIQKHVITSNRIVDTLKSVCSVHGDCVKEISVNQNGMVPLPGTLQNGFKVKFHMWRENEIR